MRIKAGHVTVVAAVTICMSHVLLLPYIYFGVSRIPPSDRIDIAMLIGPMTTAYFITIVRFGIDNRYQNLIESSRYVNFLYVFVASVSTIPLLSGLYIMIYQYENLNIDSIDVLKRCIGVVELFFGAAFALFADTVFGGSQEVKQQSLPPKQGE